MTAVVPSRNAPCPCGSGLRYKECHGRVGPGAAAPAPASASAELGARMQGALAAQQAGRIDDAIDGYGAVIDAAPQVYDAWHMRGVARFQRQEFDAAEQDILRALALAPTLDAARRNLALVRQGRRLAAEEEALCRAVLPRYRARVEDPARDPLEDLRAGATAWIVDAGSRRPRLADAFAQAAESRGARVVRVAIARGQALDDATASALAAAVVDDAVVCVGCAHPLGDWTLATAAGIASLIASDEPLATFLDRLGELAAHGRRRVRVALAPGATLDLAGLPHRRMEAA